MTNAIRTRFYAANSTRPSRIVATDGTRSITVADYPRGLEPEPQHRSACTEWVFKYSTLGGVIKLTPAWFDGDCYWTLDARK